ESFACAEVEELPVSVVASENSEIMLIDCKRIITTCSSSCRFHNMIIHNLLQVLATKNLAFNKKIEITSKRTTRDKLMTYLLSQAKIHGSSSFEIPFDRQELADYLGVERSAMSKEISKMKDDGLIECERSWFKVKGDVI
ncbi:MAG: Crp/Fnr family transcriptional regulator, partial [Firmicutes bacterium]|nr:Crp/Fnr family transcriptional regulator [Bacillota bacterium]